MSLATLNGIGVIEGEVSLPRLGVWVADLRLDTPTVLSGQAALAIAGGPTLIGTIVRSGVWQDVVSVMVVGGAGGVRRTAKPAAYTSTSLRIVAADLLRGVGELLAPSADAAVLATPLNAWTTDAQPAGRLLTRLAQEASAVWRTLPDGRIWIGRETWPAAGLVDADTQLLELAPSQGIQVLGVQAPTLMPGTTLGDQRVSYVQWYLEPDAVRVRAFMEDGQGALPDRLAAALASLAGQALPPIDYYALYSATVTTQSGGTVDVEPDDPRLRSQGQVPLYAGTPGTAISMPPGGRVLLGWSGGDPARPYALAFDAATRLTKLVITADDVVVIGSELGAQPPAQATTLATYLRAAMALIAGHVHPGVTVGAGVTAPAANLVPPALDPPDFSAPHSRVG